MEWKINAGKTRSVSMRSLARETAALLDEIEEEGIGLVVLRYGRPTALLVPLEQPVRRAPRRVAIEEIDQAEKPHDETTVVEQIAQLDDIRRFILTEAARRAPKPLSPSECRGPGSDLATALGRLELAGLIDRDGGYIWLTTLGRDVAARLGPLGQG